MSSFESLEEAISNNKVTHIVESHSDRALKKLLIDNMAALKKNGCGGDLLGARSLQYTTCSF